LRLRYFIFVNIVDHGVDSQSQSVAFREQLETARSNTIVEKDDALRITPRPFIVDSSGEGVLALENLHANEWLTVRVLISAPRLYGIHPQKVIIPPQRSSTISVRLRSGVDVSSSREAGLMLQWYAHLNGIWGFIRVGG
ncbi:hypothetical protein COOONC_23641, partial [Cooperia oncophora]